MLSFFHSLMSYNEDNEVGVEYVHMNSSMSAVPENIWEHQKPVAQKILKLIQLVAQKYGLRGYFNVKARFNRLAPYSVSVMLLNYNSSANSRAIDKQNKEPMAYLKAFSESITKEPSSETLGYQIYSIITLDSAKLDDIITGLTLLNDSLPAEYGLRAKC